MQCSCSAACGMSPSREACNTGRHGCAARRVAHHMLLRCVQGKAGKAGAKRPAPITPQPAAAKKQKLDAAPATAPAKVQQGKQDGKASGGASSAAGGPLRLPGLACAVCFRGSF